jgi:hypothetical protein
MKPFDPFMFSFETVRVLEGVEGRVERNDVKRDEKGTEIGLLLLLLSG